MGQLGWDCAGKGSAAIAAEIAKLPSKRGGLKAVVTQGALCTVLAETGKEAVTYEVKGNPWTLTRTCSPTPTAPAMPSAADSSPSSRLAPPTPNAPRWDTLPPAPSFSNRDAPSLRMTRLAPCSPSRRARSLEEIYRWAVCDGPYCTKLSFQ